MAKPAKMSRSTSTEVPDEEGIQHHPHQNDILSGRGNRSNYHPGNEYFVALVKQYRKEYLMRSKKAKVKLAQNLIDEIAMLDPPGRFLKQHPESQRWYEISHKKIMDKTRQCLRDGAPKLLKEIKSVPPQKKQRTQETTYASPAMDPEEYDSDDDDEEDDDEGVPEDGRRGPRRGDGPQYRYHTEDNEEEDSIAPDQQRSFNPADDSPFNEDPQCINHSSATQRRSLPLVMSRNLDQQALPQFLGSSTTNMTPSALPRNPSPPYRGAAEVSLLDMTESFLRRDLTLPHISRHRSSLLPPGLGGMDLEQQMAIHRLEILRLQNQQLADEQFQIAYPRGYLQSSSYFPPGTSARSEYELRAQDLFAQRNHPSRRPLP
eukprot:scaffold118656_cov49-Attheya_sp.AAC.2